MPRSEQLDDLTRAFPFVRALDEPGRRAVLAEGARRQLPPGAFICMEGDRCPAIAFVLSGRARVYKSSDTGREVTLYRIGRGESCILTASCILSGRAFPAFAVTETAVDAFLVPAASFRRYVEGSEPWRRYVFDLLTRRLGTIIEVVEAVAFGRLDARLAAHLEARASAEDGPLTVRATHEAIAAELGSSREVISRLLKELEAEGLVRRLRGAVELRDVEGLRRLGASVT